MATLGSILAATDFSVDSTHAADRAALLAATLHLKKGVLLHVLETSWVDSVLRMIRRGPEAGEEVVREAEKANRKLSGRIARRTGFSLQPEVRVGTLMQTLLEAAEVYDLVAVGSRGLHPLREMALGTTGQRLLRKTRKPVLVVKRVPKKPYERVVVGVDFSESSQRVLDYANLVAPGAELFLLHAFEAPIESKLRLADVSQETIDRYMAEAHDAAVAEMRRFIGVSSLWSSLKWGVSHGYPPVVLREKAHEWDADLVVVGKHGNSPIENYFLGSVTEHVLAEISRDVLVV